MIRTGFLLAKDWTFYVFTQIGTYDLNQSDLLKQRPSASTQITFLDADGQKRVVTKNRVARIVAENEQLQRHGHGLRGHADAPDARRTWIRARRRIGAPQPRMETYMKLSLFRSLLVLGGAVCFAAVSQSLYAQAKAEGGKLTGGKGMTLYVFDKDAGGKSACNGPCAINWPPMMAADSDKAAGDNGIIARDDGKKQWAYKGRPLYYWIKDQKPGDTTGDGVGGTWHTAKP